MSVVLNLDLGLAKQIRNIKEMVIYMVQPVDYVQAQRRLEKASLMVKEHKDEKRPPIQICQSCCLSKAPIQRSSNLKWVKMYV